MGDNSVYLYWLSITTHNIMYYLCHDTSLEGKAKATKVHRMASRYVIEVVHLYKRGFSTFLLKCLIKAQVDYVLNKIHKAYADSTLAAELWWHRYNRLATISRP
ncbi:hypothetical protein CR513_16839, partial [Mucuna pruriens]